ncbi:ABC transporter substrate-binding protein [Phytoactinopolyspora limicola]|uniref:ABC transporter substrate-binding protein n=1 Tax=Phytoactinopolyspora limicola TaxID=2715536 RepID=UPI00140CC09B|nr:ABC transporter substrate-binding protein [Phytoactinopolyspora limicola]
MNLGTSLRRSMFVALGALIMTGVAACGSDDADPGDTTTVEAGDNTTTEGGGNADAVTVTHRFGTTVIDAVPQRVVTIDSQWTDVMLAMGVEPVGHTIDSYLPDSITPWQELPADAAALTTVDGLPFEQISALEPDLIVGTFTIADDETYTLLSGIAPTVASLDSGQVSPWHDLVDVAGDILRDVERATSVIDAVDRRVADVAADLRGLAGQTFALAQYIVGDSMYIVADEDDGSSVFFQQLGMQLYPPVVSEAENASQARLNVATERADLLRADLLAFLVNGGDEDDLTDIPGFDQLPGTVAVLDYATIVALNTPSPLSIPYALDRLLPYLEDANG